MKPSSLYSSFVLTIKAVGLAATITLAIILGASFGITHAQQQQQQMGSDGGLAATLNSESFTAGDTITVNGAVQDRESYSYVSIVEYDPQRRTVDHRLTNRSICL